MFKPCELNVTRVRREISLRLIGSFLPSFYRFSDTLVRTSASPQNLQLASLPS